MWVEVAPMFVETKSSDLWDRAWVDKLGPMSVSFGGRGLFGVPQSPGRRVVSGMLGMGASSNLPYWRFVAAPATTYQMWLDALHNGTYTSGRKIPDVLYAALQGDEGTQEKFLKMKERIQRIILLVGFLKAHPRATVAQAAAETGAE